MKDDNKSSFGLAFGAALTFAILIGAVAGTTLLFERIFPSEKPTGDAADECRLYGKYTDC